MGEWIPGATVVPCNLDGGSMLGGEAYCTMHTYESKGYGLSAVEAARRLVAAGNGCTGTFNPITGEIAQMIPASRASRTLRNLSGGVQTNRAGRFHSQFEVVGDANRPWTQDLTPAGKAGLARIIAWNTEHGVPLVWPAGPPPAFFGGTPNKLGPGPSGYYAHSQWKENNHGDPGALDLSIFFGSGSGVAPPPAPPVPVPTPVRKPIPTQRYHGSVYLSNLKKGRRNEDVRRYQVALRDYPGIKTIPLNPSGATGFYGKETIAMTEEMYRVFEIWEPGVGWGVGDCSEPGRKLLSKLGLSVR